MIPLRSACKIIFIAHILQIIVLLFKGLFVIFFRLQHPAANAEPNKMKGKAYLGEEKQSPSPRQRLSCPFL